MTEEILTKDEADLLVLNGPRAKVAMLKDDIFDTDRYFSKIFSNTLFRLAAYLLIVLILMYWLSAGVGIVRIATFLFIAIALFEALVLFIRGEIVRNKIVRLRGLVKEQGDSEDVFYMDPKTLGEDFMYHADEVKEMVESSSYAKKYFKNLGDLGRPILNTEMEMLRVKVKIVD